MGVNYNPKITNNGLIACYDATNPRSYDGTVSWRDASSNDIAGLLAANYTYTSGYNGYISFAGASNSFCNISLNNSSSTISIEMIARFNTIENKMPFGFFQYNIYGASGAIGYNTLNSDVYGIGATQVTNLGLLGNWKHYVFEMRSDVSYTNNKIYVNGVSQSLSQILGTENAPTRVFSIIARIGGFRGGTTYNMPMDISIFRAYNRALTQEEIDLNFSILRKRVNI